MPNGLEHDTNSEISQEDRDDKYSHFLSCEIEYEPEILQCDTIIIDDDDTNSKGDITEVNVKKDNEKKDISLPPKDSTSDNKENNIKKELHKIFKCKKCGQTFKTKFKFRKHHKILHLKAIPSKKCKICSRPIQTLKNISTANTIQRSNYKNYCQYCCKIFSVKSLLTSNSKRNRTTKYNCDNCEKTFKTKCSLLKHKQRHTPKKVLRVLRSYSKTNSSRKK